MIDLFQKRLKYLAESHGFSMKALSEGAGLETSTVRKIINGNSRTAKIETLYKLSKPLKMYPSELLPVEWQAPRQSIDEKMMRDVATKLLPIYDEFRDKGNSYTPAEFALFITLIYNKYISQGSFPQKAEIIQLFKK